MLWSSTGVLLNDVARDRIAIEIVPLKWCRTSIVLQSSSATAINNPNFRKRNCEEDIDFCRILRVRRSQSGLVHILQQFFRCFTEPVDLLRLTHLLKKLFLVLTGFKLLDQLGDCRLSLLILLLNRWEGCLEFGSPPCCIRSLGSSAFRFAFPKMILFLDHVNLVIHISNLLWAQHVVLRFLFAKLLFSFRAYRFLSPPSWVGNKLHQFTVSWGGFQLFL